ncbi:MAG: hypothetical protein AB7V22_03800 [Kiritimatiellia bacterium]
MEEFLHRFIEGFASRLSGPFSFRMIVQPLMAVIFAIIDGLKDAKWGKPAYFWALFGSAEHRRELLKDGWKHFGKIFILAIILDLVYQLKVQQPVNVAAVIVAALILAVLPYMALRGPINRIARLFRK